jgi:hypothetical protein
MSIQIYKVRGFGVLYDKEIYPEFLNISGEEEYEKSESLQTIMYNLGLTKCYDQFRDMNGKLQYNPFIYISDHEDNQFFYGYLIEAEYVDNTHFDNEWVVECPELTDKLRHLFTEQLKELGFEKEPEIIKIKVWE